MGGQRKQIVAGGDGFQDGTIVNADISASAAIDASKLSGVQASDATLTSIAALGTAADKMLYTTGVDTWAETALTAAARTVLDDATTGDMLTTLGAAAASHAHATSDITSGTLTHERGGLEADVSAYDGLIRIASGATTNLKSNFAGTVAPTANEDSGDGYVVGSRWIDTTNDKEYVCLDNTLTAAVWTETTQSGAAGIGGSTGSTDNAILRADGTGGATAQSSAVTIADNSTITALISSAGNTIEHAFYNTSNTANSSVQLTISSGGSSAGDASTVFNISGATNWGIGADNSDSDTFKVSRSNILGTNDTLVINSTKQLMSTYDGAVGTPAFSFTSDTDTGIYRIGTDNLGIATAGVKAIDIDSAQKVSIPNPSIGRLDPQVGAFIIHDFNTNVNSSPVTSGTGSTTSVTDLFAGSNVLGVITLTTGTTTTGRAATSINNGNKVELAIAEGAMTVEGYVSLSALSDGTDTYLFKLGLLSTTSGTTDSDAIMFIYDSTTSANWRYSTRSASSETIASSSTAVSTAWTHLKIVVNAAGTSVEFFVDGVSVGTSATNIPTNIGLLLGVGIFKSAGTTSRNAYCDYIANYNTFTTARN